MGWGAAKVSGIAEGSLEAEMTEDPKTAGAALDDTLAHVFNDSGYRTAWERLLPADKAVLRALAQGMSDLHSLSARKRLGEELGSKIARRISVLRSSEQLSATSMRNLSARGAIDGNVRQLMRATSRDAPPPAAAVTNASAPRH